ncbi:cysteine desulfurase sulfur acceptor subunit CsdE [uncultured Vibrio sp.]|uniref:cysteine desulfurase sulfur acceptor subunit CsdE n=1 Tax=uncultured Vibrio sp. TaxID=114054 RepID=UPI000921F809|nr:cysteine desulfurase sulfur acceptor subunit CsdE [uncultured Vibrio sp.]OIQ25741.1 MAG: cysteine desulfurase, sulfur acceptor subunit CsdE [Vibrio sp. MedPE-SWchi]
MTDFPRTPFGHDITVEEIVSTMQAYKGWEDKYRQVIKWGKLLPNMPDDLKNDQVTVLGCESKVWLVSAQYEGVWTFCADSDARIVRGLIALVLAAFDGKSTQQIQEFDVDAYFESLGLISHLSASRGNGLKAIVEQIKSVE